MARTTVVLAATSLLALSATMAPNPALGSERTPAGLHAASATATGLSLAWKPVSGARGYRVQFSSSPSMASAKYARFTGTSGVLRSLSPKRRYYFRVRVIDPRTGAGLSRYTPKVYPSATTASVPVPTGLRASSTSESSVSLAWTPSEGATSYRVAASTSPTFASSTYYGSTTPATTVSGLRPGTTYYFHVRVLGTSGVTGTAYSAPTSAQTAQTQPPGGTTTPGPYNLRVGSFNVMTVTGDQTTGDRLPWAQRRATVVKEILGEKVDIIGVQEVNQSYTMAKQLVDGGTQFLDLKNGLNSGGGTYALTNEDSYNCVRPETSYKCVYQDRGASGGDRIYYNTSTLAMVSQGSYRYQAQDAGAMPWGGWELTYAVMRVKATGARFLFTNTHLDPTNQDVKIAQWHELIDKVNEIKGSLPVINVGDYNTQKFDVRIQPMLPAMKAAGYGDVLNQTYNTNPVANPRAESTVNGYFNSLGRYNRDTRTYSYYTNRAKTGNSIDWIFASNSLPVREYKVVLDYDPTTLQVNGVIPSDHNMIRATLTLP